MSTEVPPKDVTFHFLKSKDFRIVHVDGAWGGLTPKKLLSVNFYSERAPIPREIRVELTDSGQLGKEIGRETKVGLIREVEVGLLLDIDTAKSVVSWLQGLIDQAETSPTEGKS